MPTCSSPPHLASPSRRPDQGIGDAIKSSEEMHLLRCHGLHLHLLRPDLGANAPPPPQDGDVWIGCQKQLLLAPACASGLVVATFGSRRGRSGFVKEYDYT